MRHVLTSMLRYFKHNTLALTSKYVWLFSRRKDPHCFAHIIESSDRNLNCSMNCRTWIVYAILWTKETIPCKTLVAASRSVPDRHTVVSTEASCSAECSALYQQELSILKTDGCTSHSVTNPTAVVVKSEW